MKKTTIAGLGLICLGLIFSNLALAASKEKVDKDDDKNPTGCYNTGYAQHLKVLTLLPGESGPRNSMYFVYNKMDKPVNLFQMRDGDSVYSLHLNHTIPPQKWAVFATSEEKLKFLCSVDDKTYPKYGHIVDCAQTVKVCEFTNVKFGLNNRGNYWMVKGNTRNGALREVVHYGIIPAI